LTDYCHTTDSRYNKESYKQPSSRSQDPKLFERLSQPNYTLNGTMPSVAHLKRLQEEKEMQECKFMPTINPNSNGIISLKKVDSSTKSKANEFIY